MGNAAALDIATDSIRLLAPALRVGFVTWWELDESLTAAMLAEGADVHANRAETSMMLAIAPGSVRMDAVSDADDPDRTASLVFRYTAGALSRNGVTGRPSEATTEEGQRLFDVAVDRLTGRLERARREEPPLAEVVPPQFPF